MNGSSHLLDSNIIIAYLNEEAAIRRRLAGITAYAPTIALGELFFGAYRSNKVAENLKTIAEFVSIVEVLDWNLLTAQHYGRIRQSLIAKGRPIPENDIWIAAIAQQHNLTLATRDEHFKQVDGLRLELW